jgi:hypothetical protein
VFQILPAFATLSPPDKPKVSIKDNDVPLANCILAPIVILKKSADVRILLPYVV